MRDSRLATPGRPSPERVSSGSYDKRRPSLPMGVSVKDHNSLLVANWWHKLWGHKWAMHSSDLHDAVFVVGALDETMMLRGMRYHPVDVEMSVMRAHKNICEWFDLINKLIRSIDSIWSDALNRLSIWSIDLIRFDDSIDWSDSIDLFKSIDLLRSIDWSDVIRCSDLMNQLSFSAVFTWSNLLVVVAELEGDEGEALDLVPAITSRLVEVRVILPMCLWYLNELTFKSCTCRSNTLSAASWSWLILQWSRLTRGARNNACIYAMLSYRTNSIRSMLLIICDFNSSEIFGLL